MKKIKKSCLKVLAEFGLAVCFVDFGSAVWLGGFGFGGLVWRFWFYFDYSLDFLLSSVLSSRDRFYRFTSEHQ